MSELEGMKMRDYLVPLQKPNPDMELFLDVMSGRKMTDKPPMVEYLIDDYLMKPILKEMIGRPWVETGDKSELIGGRLDVSNEELEAINAWLDNNIAFWYHMGYDFIRMEVSLPLPAEALVTSDTAKGHEDHERSWQGLHKGPISDWQSFETYPWPEIGDDNFYLHRYICEHLPDGLGFITCHARGVFENLSRLMGYETLCYKLIDDPKLVEAVTNKIGNLVHTYYSYLLQLDGVSVIFQGDDLGFNSQTLISPEDIREYILPWHKKLASLCHESGTPYYLHSCGRIDSIMEDLIEDVKIDGKHSFQDSVFPVVEAKERYGDRICILGGVDVDKLASSEPENLRRYVRSLIDTCGSGGRFAIGAGNSIPSYIPLENYLTMLDEAQK